MIAKGGELTSQARASRLRRSLNRATAKTVFVAWRLHDIIELNLLDGLQIDGKHAGTIKSRALCQSLLGIYLGSSPVSPDAKESIGTGLAALVSHES